MRRGDGADLPSCPRWNFSYCLAKAEAADRTSSDTHWDKQMLWYWHNHDVTLCSSTPTPQRVWTPQHFLHSPEQRKCCPAGEVPTLRVATKSGRASFPPGKTHQNPGENEDRTFQKHLTLKKIHKVTLRNMKRKIFLSIFYECKCCLPLGR